MDHGGKPPTAAVSDDVVMSSRAKMYRELAHLAHVARTQIDNKVTAGLHPLCGTYSHCP